MIENFKFYNPTELIFGRHVVEHLHKNVVKYGQKALLVYGQKSAIQNGSYQYVKDILVQNNIAIFEYNGIKSNPIYQDVDKAAEIARVHNVDVIIALGGGSVIDSAKLISITAPSTYSSWDFIKNKAEIRKAIPLICILTLAATGSEMNPFAVIQNNETKEKLSLSHKLLFPKYAYLDPSLTFSTPASYTAYGIVDIISHTLEAYFGKGSPELIDNICCTLIKHTIEKGHLLLKDLNNYDLRADIMLASTLALNGTTFYGRSYGDWGTHSAGHVLSSLYDLPHGATLSMAYPAWLKLHAERLPQRISYLGKQVFNVDGVAQTIAKFEQCFKEFNTPVYLSDLKIAYSTEDIFQAMLSNNVNGYVHKLSDADLRKLINLMNGK